MHLSRRTVLKQLGLVTGCMLLLPACFHRAKPGTIALNNIKVDGDQEELLGNIVETIIPAGKIPGARELNLHHFVLTMIDDCQDPKNQKIFLSGLADIETRAKKEFGGAFADIYSEQRNALLKEVENESDGKKAEGKMEHPPTFLSLTKRYTTQGFLQSEYVMTNIIPYNMIPGRFDGCIAMEKNRKIIAG